MTAIDPEYDRLDDFALIDELNSRSGVDIPQAIRDIINADIRHDTVCEINEMEKKVKDFLRIDE